MKHDFDKLIDRRGTACVKWDLAPDEDVIPMWVADMDFEVAPAIVEGLRKRIEHGIFGYNIVPDSYYESLASWFSRRHGFNIQRDWVQTVPGVVPAISCVIKALTRPGDSVLFLTPAYNCFFSSVRNNGCNAEMSPLKPVGDTFEIDFDDFERRAAKPETRIFLLCSPHNPSGRVWRRDELERLYEICLRHDVIVASDEIHCEIVMPGYEHIPFATLSQEALDNSITMLSPTKGFNFAGLQIANIVCNNPDWRAKIDRAINDNEVCDLNPFGIIALQAAYNDSEDWLDEMNEYVYGNYKALKDFFSREMPQLQVARLEGTYLPWVDVSSTHLTAEQLSERLTTEGHVWMNGGKMYGDPQPQQHLRINIACPRSRMMEGLERMARIVKSL
jgi:cystathionine beta-lyase